MSHTQGPWWVEVLASTTNIEARDQTVALDVSNCDANLIAAAPEMLITLKGALNYLRTLRGGTPTTDAKVCALIEDTIAKAEGKEGK